MVSGRETVPQAQGTSGTVQLNNEHSADGLVPCPSAVTWNPDVCLLS